MWLTLFKFIASTLLMSVLTNRMQKQTEMKPGEVSLPDVDEGRPVPVVFGTAMVTPQLLWAGDFSHRKSTKKISTDPFGLTSKRVTTGYKYYGGLMLGLCEGADDSFGAINQPELEILDVQFLEKSTFEGASSLKSGIYRTLSSKYLFNVEAEKPKPAPAPTEYSFIGIIKRVSSKSSSETNGVHARIRFSDGTDSFHYYFSRFSDSIPDNVFESGSLTGSDETRASRASSVANTQPGNATAALLWGGPTAGVGSGYYGNSPTVPSLAVAVRSMHSVGLGSPEIGEFGTNPANILHYLHIDSTAGLGLSADSVNEASFADFHSVMSDENLGLSFVWDRQNSAVDVIERVLEITQGIRYIGRHDGKIHIGAIRGGGDPVATFDASNVVEIQELMSPDFSDCLNDIRVKYSELSNDQGVGFKTTERVASAQDQALIDSIGARSKEFDYPELCSSDSAQAITGRELSLLSYPLRIAKFSTTGRAAHDVEIGSLVKVSLGDVDMEAVVQSMRFDLESFGVEIAVREAPWTTGHEVLAISLCLLIQLHILPA